MFKRSLNPLTAFAVAASALATFAMANASLPPTSEPDETKWLDPQVQLEMAEQDALASALMALKTEPPEEASVQAASLFDIFLKSLQGQSPAPTQNCRTLDGMATIYGRERLGHRTANGERFNPDGITAAHRTLPYNSHVRVTNLKNGRAVIVRINDRGPFVAGMIIDLSSGTARAIGMKVASKVRLEICI